MTTTPAEPMAKSNSDQKPFQVKLPGEYHKPLQKTEALTGRPMSVSVQMALELYFRLMGVPFKPNWPEVKLTNES